MTPKFSFADVLNSVTVPSDPHARKAILDVLKDISDQWAKIEGFNSYIKEAIDGAAEKHEIPKKYIRKLARAYHAQTFQKERDEMEDFTALYEAVVGDE